MKFNGLRWIEHFLSDFSEKDSVATRDKNLGRFLSNQLGCFETFSARNRRKAASFLTLKQRIKNLKRNAGG